MDETITDCPHCFGDRKETIEQEMVSLLERWTNSRMVKGSPLKRDTDEFLFEWYKRNKSLDSSIEKTSI